MRDNNNLLYKGGSMNTFFFIARRYISTFLMITMFTYVYIINTCPSCEGVLKKDSPAFFAEELEEANDAELTDNAISTQEPDLTLSTQ